MEEGCASLLKVTVEVAAVQTPLETVQTKELLPIPKDVIWELAAEGETIVPLPDNKDQLPVPKVGEVAAMVAVVEHTV